MGFTDLQETIGYTFKDIHLLVSAMTHSSYANEHPQDTYGDNERLEFLGDAVLELSSSDFLYRHYPGMKEGQLSKLRASLVCESSLARCARDIGLPSFIRLGHGEERTGGRMRDSVISDAMEALLGAVYLDGGYEEAKRLAETLVLQDIEHRRLFFDSKTVLQEMLKKQRSDTQISYELTGEEGPDHAKQFLVCVKVDGEILGNGKGPSKKAAQQQAAYQAILKLQGSVRDHEGTQ